MRADVTGEHFFCRDRDFYKRIFTLMGALILQNLLSFSVNLADNIMLGSYSQTALSGAATVNQIQFFVQMVAVGIGDGLVVLGSQYWGQKRTSPIVSLTGIALCFGWVFGLAVTFAVGFFPHQVLSFFTNDEAIIAAGTEYLVLMRFTYLLFITTTILLAMLRSAETVKIAMLLAALALMTNVGLNYTFIFGHFGAPELGITGAATGTITSRILELSVLLFYLCRVDKKLKIRFREMFRPDRRLRESYFRVCLPVVVTQALWGLSNPLQTAIIGHLSSDAIAANSAATTLYSTLKVIAIASASASGVVIGKAVGSGNAGKIREYARSLQVLYLGIGVLTSILLLLFRNPVLSLYSMTPAAMELAGQIINVLAVTCIGTSYQMPVLGGIVRGGGDTKFVLYNDLISIWGIVLPVSFLAAFVWKLPVLTVIILLNSDQIFKCGAAFIKCNRYHWIKKLTIDSKQTLGE